MKYITLTTDDGDAAFEEIERRFQARLNGCEDLCNPTLTPFLQNPSFDKLLSLSDEPIDISAVGFGFKGKNDPAGVAPLQDLTITTASERLFHIGSALDIRELPDNQVMPLNNINQIGNLTTYYVEAAVAKSDTDKRYKRRIVAICYDYMNNVGQPRSRVLCATSSAFAQVITLDRSVDQVRAACDLVMAAFNERNSDYVMNNEVNALKLNMLPLGPDKRRLVFTNLAYRQIKGRTNSYIENLGFVSTIKLSAKDFLPKEKYEKITFQIPFSQNITNQNVDFEVEVSQQKNLRSLIASTSQHGFSIGIPSITSTAASGASVAIGQIAAYNYSRNQSREVEGTLQKGNKATVKMTFGQSAYLLDTALQSSEFDAVSIITIYGPNDQQLLKLSVPTSVPGFSIPEGSSIQDVIIAAI